nr:unnamed protein product [Callosobruchus analis]
MTNRRGGNVGYNTGGTPRHYSSPEAYRLQVRIEESGTEFVPSVQRKRKRTNFEFKYTALGRQDGSSSSSANESKSSFKNKTTAEQPREEEEAKEEEERVVDVREPPRTRRIFSTTSLVELFFCLAVVKSLFLLARLWSLSTEGTSTDRWFDRLKVVDGIRRMNNLSSGFWPRGVTFERFNFIKGQRFLDKNVQQDEHRPRDFHNLLPKIELIQTEVICYNPAVLITSEARTVAEIEDCEVVIQDYQLVRCDSSSRHTGGIVIYIRNGIEYKVKKKIISDPNYWFSFIEVKVSGQKWSIGGVYHSPSASDADFIDKLEDVLDDYFSVSLDISLEIDFTQNIKSTVEDGDNERGEHGNQSDQNQRWLDVACTRGLNVTTPSFELDRPHQMRCGIVTCVRSA